MSALRNVVILDSPEVTMLCCAMETLLIEKRKADSLPPSTSVALLIDFSCDDQKTNSYFRYDLRTRMC